MEKNHQVPPNTCGEKTGKSEAPGDSEAVKTYESNHKKLMVVKKHLNILIKAF